MPIILIVFTLQAFGCGLHAYCIDLAKPSIAENSLKNPLSFRFSINEAQFTSFGVVNHGYLSSKTSMSPESLVKYFREILSHENRIDFVKCTFAVYIRSIT